jgi:PPOX class probable F420-dependent enzyme
MRKITVNELGNALAQPWLAILATFRHDGTPLLSPVWYEWDGGSFVVSVSKGAWKEKHIRRDPRVGICIAEEATYPGRVIEASGLAELEPDPNATGFYRIATRYLGEEIAHRYIYEELPKVLGPVEWELMRLAPARIRAIDHRDDEFFLDATPRYQPEPRRSPLG